MLHFILLTLYIVMLSGLFGISKLNTGVQKRGVNGKVILRVSHTNLFIVFSMGVLMFLTMFRGNSIGNDTMAYKLTFEMINNYGLGSEQRMEVGYKLLNLIVGFFTQEYQWLLILTSLFIYICFVHFIKRNSKDVFFSVVLFYFLIFMMIASTIRQSIAMAIILIGYNYLKNDKIYKFFIVVILASLFHLSALISLIFPFMYKSKYNMIKGLSVIGISVIMTYFNIFRWVLNVLDIRRYDAYSVQVNGGIAPLMEIFISLLFLIVGIIVFRKKVRTTDGKILTAKKYLDRPESSFVVWSVVFNISCWIITRDLPIMQRFTYYFMMIFIIYLPNVLQEYNNRNNRIIFKLLIVLILFGYEYSTLIFRPDWSSIFPYKFFWN